MKRGGCSQLLHTALRSYTSRCGRTQTRLGRLRASNTYGINLHDPFADESAQTSVRGRRRFQEPSSARLEYLARLA